MRCLLILLIVSIGLQSCQENPSQTSASPSEDKGVDSLAHYISDGKLTAIIENNISSYYIKRGRPRGFEYEMLKAFCDDHNLELEVKMINGVDFILDSILAFKADVGAGNLSVTGHRKELVSFSPPLLKTRQVLIQAMPENYKRLSRSQIKKRLVSDALELDGKSVYVSAKSSFYTRLKNLSDENGLDIHIQVVHEDYGIDDLVELVSRGELPFTILDENLGHIYKNLYPNIDYSTPISLSQNISWAIHPENKGLLILMEKWFEKNRNGSKWNTIYKRYFGKNSQEISFLKHQGNSSQHIEISPYDKLIQKYAKRIDWDWRLIAALIKKESNFNPDIESKFGATGLMQLLPNTAERFGVSPENLKDPEQNIKAGTAFLSWLEKYWQKHLDDSTDLKPFILASYNTGPGHVQDAIKLARKYGCEHLEWENNVEVMLGNKSKPTYYKDPVVKHGYCRGREPVNYVKEVYKYYGYYKVYSDFRNQQMPVASIEGGLTQE